MAVTGGGITGYIQAKDTDLHKRRKALYREEEMNLILKMLETDKSKIPSPNRGNMITMLDFRDTLIRSDVRNNLQGVVKQLMPPKGIKRNFEEGSEFLEYIDNLDNDEDQSNSSDKLDEEIYDSNDDDDESEFANEEMNECANEEIAQSSKNTPRSTKIKSLVDISPDPLINKDARFLKQI